MGEVEYFWGLGSSGKNTFRQLRKFLQGIWETSVFDCVVLID